MRKLTIVFALVVACMLSLDSLYSEDKGKADAIASDEYAVYTAAMEQAVGALFYVVMDTTSMHDKPENIDRALSFPVEHGNLITEDLVKDFRFRNQQSHRLTQNFPPNISVTLITENERSAFFADSYKSGWTKFYERYKGASGITTLSCAGFNEKRDTAIVYVGNVRHWESGSGAYLLLVKADGKWKVISETRGWIS